MNIATKDEQLAERLNWLIRLRWLAVGSVLVVITSAWRFLRLDLPFQTSYLTSLFLAFYNLLFYLSLRFVKWRGAYTVMANLQISLDLLVLAILLHFAGGIENPFIFYFIFHMIIASILLSRRTSFFQATLAALLFLLVVGLEYFGVLPHYNLHGFVPAVLYANPLYVLGVSFVFTSTIFVAVYMATSISGQLREREKSLSEANALLEEKDRVKSEYVLRVSHDIKEHLAAITSCIEPVTDGLTGPLAENQKDLLIRARDRTQKLLAFVRALLEITRLKLTKGLKMEEFSFQEMIKGIEENIRSRAADKEISFKVEIAPEIDKILGTRVYLEEAIENLLLNAVKYTPRGGRISLSVGSLGGNWLIKIADNGIGIPQADLPFIFEEFYRAQNARELEKTGTGLGLSISKKIIEMHKGKIRIESEIGQGTTFFVELPKYGII